MTSWRFLDSEIIAWTIPVMGRASITPRPPNSAPPARMAATDIAGCISMVLLVIRGDIR